MFYLLGFLVLLNCLSPAMASDHVEEYQLLIGNLSGDVVVSWEGRIHGVRGWRQLRRRLAPEEEVRLVLGFEPGRAGSSIVEQGFSHASGEHLGNLLILHHRSFAYPAFIVDELYARAFGEIELSHAGGRSIVVRLGRRGQQVLYARSQKDSDLWFFF